MILLFWVKKSASVVARCNGVGLVVARCNSVGLGSRTTGIHSRSSSPCSIPGPSALVIVLALVLLLVARRGAGILLQSAIYTNQS